MGLMKDFPREHTSFCKMKERCRSPRHDSFKYYGGRGISVDPRWNTFAQFIADMGPKPDGFEIDRIDNDGPYSPENCRWASKQENRAKKRLPSNNKTGIKNVVFFRSGFRVLVRRNGQFVALKYFDDFFEACCLAKRFQQGETA